MVDFRDVFPVEKPVIGMIHLNGSDTRDTILRAVYEMQVFDDVGFDGVIIEDYHGSIDDVRNFLDVSMNVKTNLVKGINTLRDPYHAFELAKEFDAKFIQLDSVQPAHIYLREYNQFRTSYPDISVLGGVRFKYQSSTGKTLEQDINDALPLCEAVVTTGEGTGIETPIEKLNDFKQYLPNFPLIVGAGVNRDNVYEQMKIADGMIIGSGVKFQGNTRLMVDPREAEYIVNQVRDIRKL